MKTTSKAEDAFSKSLDRGDFKVGKVLTPTTLAIIKDLYNEIQRLRQRGDALDRTGAALRGFSRAMEEKLEKRASKLDAGRRIIPPLGLLKLLRAETVELEVALECLSRDDAADEAVDVANYAALIWKRLKAR